MCESNAYLLKDGKKELLMESVGLVRTENNGVFLKSIFGETLQVNAQIIEMNLTGHEILLGN
ncbi:MAG: CooT family nickel-binding protein [Syntrophaceae bacterium]|jgi:predicted RNA-binding protein|nr:CooT family nickel-binding protein [Syntrophaceae bacterium]